MLSQKNSFSESIPLDNTNSLLYAVNSVAEPEQVVAQESSTLAPEVKQKIGLQAFVPPSPELSKEFTNFVQQLHKESGREQRRQPRVGRKELDLLTLYLSVQRHGGYQQIQQWKELGTDLQLPKTVTNSGYILRTKYEQFLLPFEHQIQQRFPVDQQTGLLVLEKNHDNWIQHYGANQQYNANQQQYMNISSYDPYPQPSSPYNANLSYYSHIPEQYRRAGYQQTASSQLRSFKMESYPFNTDTLEEVMKKNQNLQEMYIGSLKDCQRCPKMQFFPPNLKRLTLIDVPKEISTELMFGLQQLNLQELNIQIYKPSMDNQSKSDEGRIEKYSLQPPSSLD